MKVELESIHLTLPLRGSPLTFSKRQFPSVYFLTKALQAQHTLLLTRLLGSADGANFHFYWKKRELQVLQQQSSQTTRKPHVNKHNPLNTELIQLRRAANNPQKVWKVTMAHQAGGHHALTQIPVPPVTVLHDPFPQLSQCILTKSPTQKSKQYIFYRERFYGFLCIHTLLYAQYNFVQIKYVTGGGSPPKSVQPSRFLAGPCNQGFPVPAPFSL